MGSQMEFNTVLSIPESALDVGALEPGQTYRVTKKGPRIFVLDIPIDLCDHNYRFVAKVVVRKLTMTSRDTMLEFEVRKLFSTEESAVISANFAKHA